MTADEAKGPRLSIIPAWIVTDLGLNPVDIRVAALLGRHTDDKGWCRRSQVKMARELGLGRSTIYDSIGRLIERGAIEKRARPVHQKGERDAAFEYRIVLDVVDAAPPAAGTAPPAVGTAPPAVITAPILTTPFNESLSSTGARANDPTAILGDVLDGDHAEALVRHFAGLGKPLTAHTARGKVKQLSGFEDPNRVSEVMIERGWSNVDRAWLKQPAQVSVATPAKASGRFIAADGREYVSIVVADNPAFASACMRAWKEMEGIDRPWALQQNAISVPADVLPKARELIATQPRETAHA